MIPDFGVPPGFLMILGAGLIPFLPANLRHIWMLLAVACSATTLVAPSGENLMWSVMGMELSLYHVDNLTFPFH